MDSPWPKFRYDAQNTGQSRSPSISLAGLEWSYTLGEHIAGASPSSPAIASDGTIYISYYGEKLYALNPDGTLKWSYVTLTPTKTSGPSPAIGSDGAVYWASFDSRLYALNPDGTLKWNYTTNSPIYSSPTIAPDGTVYACSFEPGTIYAMNPDGTLKWSYTTGERIFHSSPAIARDGTIYVGSYGIGAYYGKLYALKPNGTLKWSYTTNGFIDYSSPAIAPDGTIYIGSSDQKLYALNSNGTLKWSFTTGGYVRSSPAIASDGTIYIGSGDNKLYALNPDGTLKWSFAAEEQFSTAPVITSDETIYAGSHDSNLYALNPNGTLRWKFMTDGPVTHSIAIASDGTVYVGSYDQHIYAIGEALLPSEIAISPASFIIALGESILFTATLTSRGEPLASKTISWGEAIGWLSARGSTTDSYGQASVIYAAPRIEPFVENIPAIMTAWFSGDGIYGASQGSSIGTIKPAPLSPPSNLSQITLPSDNTPAFSWSVVSGAASYEVKTDTGSYTDVGNVTTYTVTTALSDGSHTVYVRAKDSAGNAGTEASLSFAIAVGDTTPPSVPNLTTPAHNALVNSTPTLSWQSVSDASGVTYHLQIDDNPDFSSPAVSQTGLTTSTYTVSSAEALPAGTYYWRVKAVDGANPPNESGWSERWSFRVEGALSGEGGKPLPMPLLAGVVGVVAVIGVTLFILMQRRRVARELAGYERQLRGWEEEGYEVSRLRKKYFGKRKR